MAYEFDLDTAEGVPFSDNQATEIIEFALGFDLEKDVAIIMSVMMVPIDEAYDIRFGIRERSLSHEWKVTGPNYNIEAVRTFVPKDRRRDVLQRLVAAVKMLVTKVKPDIVTMETYYPNLALEALRKYDQICTAMHESHYVTADRFRDKTSLKDHWLFLRRSGRNRKA